MTQQQGRSNVTTMVVVVTLVVIITIAFIWWRNHQTASHVETALKGADAAKVAVMEAATVEGSASHIKASELGYNYATTDNPYVAHIDIADGGLITVATRNTGARPDPSLLLTPVQSNGADHSAISWNCSVTAGDVDSVPKGCRNAAQPVTRTSIAPTASDTVSPAHSS